MKKYVLYQIDSFTKERFKGNPAGVVVNADGLDDNQMQLIARELNNSETAFLFRSDAADCDGVIRYFTPKTEVPICGHATIAAMYAKALEEKIAHTRIYRMKTKVGVLPFEIIAHDKDYKIAMTQGKIEFSDYLTGEIKNKLITALGCHEQDLVAQCPLQIVSTGHSKVMLGIKSRQALNNLQPAYAQLTVLSKLINCNGYFVFTFDSDVADILTYGRMFAPAIGINEDPVTGNAHGPLGAYLVHHQLIQSDGKNYCFKGRQGEAINRLGTIEVVVQVANNEPVQVKIMGEAVVVFRTEINYVV